jgi:hypothetical protein
MFIRRERRRRHNHYCANGCGAVLGTCTAAQDIDGSPNCCVDEEFWHGVWCDDCTEKRCETCGASPCEDVIACVRDRAAEAAYDAELRTVEPAEDYAWLEAHENGWLC